MADLFGNHIVGFPTRQLKCQILLDLAIFCVVRARLLVSDLLNNFNDRLYVSF